MDEALRAALAVRQWMDRLARAEAELAVGATLPADGLPARRMRQALECAHGVLAVLGRGEEAIRAEFAGQRPDGNGQPLARWAHGEAAAASLPRRSRTRSAEWRDVAPTPALLAARRARDAVLRVGVWSVLGDALVAQAGGVAPGPAPLIAAQCCSSEGVPPGIAPTLAYAGSDDARDFFNGHLRGVLGRIAQVHGALAVPPPMDGTAALAQRWSLAWSNAACAVYADWLQRRGGGTIAGARASLWAYNGRDCPVRFRPADGFAVIPTKGFRLHVDLWLSPALAQVLAFDAARWRTEPVDGRWQAVRLAIHDLAARDVGDSADGSRTLFRGLSVEMLYQAVFAERVAAGLPAPAALHRSAPPERGAALPADTFALHARAPQATLAAAMERFDGAHDRPVLRRRSEAPPAVDLSAAQRRAIEAWQAAADVAGGVVAHDAPRLDWQRAGPDDAFDAPDAAAALLPLGSASLWGALGDDAAWSEVAAVARVDSGWIDLPLVRIDAGAGRALHSWFALRRDDRDTLAAQGVEPARLRERLADPARCAWTCRHEGLGAFVALAVDLRG